MNRLTTKLKSTVKKMGLVTSLIGVNMFCYSIANAETVRLVEVMTSPERTVVLKELVSEFEKENPDLNVEVISVPWGEAFQKVATMIASGDIPDVIEMPDTWYESYASSGKLENLNEFLGGWTHTSDLNDQAIKLGKDSKGESYMIPYGFYLRAMFYNKKLFKEAGVEAPPATMDEFLAISEKISKIPGKYGYCFRGSAGGLNSWVMFGAAMVGDDTYFRDGVSTFADEKWIDGLTWVVNLYKNGLAPKDSLNWGFNETVGGFYSGTCAMLDQDPDALIAIADRMPAEDYGVVPMPKGPTGKSFPTLGFAGWAIFKDAPNKTGAFKLLTKLSDPQINITWNKRTGALPVFKSAENDPFYARPEFKGWFDSLNDENIIPTVMPVFLKDFAFFKESVVPRTSQQAMLGDITPQELGQQWADYLTKAYQKQN